MAFSWYWRAFAFSVKSKCSLLRPYIALSCISGWHFSGKNKFSFWRCICLVVGTERASTFAFLEKENATHLGLAFWRLIWLFHGWQWCQLCLICLERNACISGNPVLILGPLCFFYICRICSLDRPGLESWKIETELRRLLTVRIMIRNGYRRLR